MAGEAHLSEDKAQKAMIDAARLADELRGEQEHAQVRERETKKHILSSSLLLLVIT